MPKDENTERHEIFGRIPIKGSIDLRKHLNISEEKYLSVYSPNLDKCRDYLIYGMLDEVEKAGLSLMHTSEFILESIKDGTKRKEQPEDKRIERNIYQSRIDEMALWDRKLTEQLIDLVGFRRANTDEYFRHYLTLHELERTRKKFNDFKEYHKATNKNLQYQVDRLKKDIDSIANGLDSDKCWYIKNSSSGTDKYRIADLKTRLNRVLPKMSDAQKVAVGITYSSYALQSQKLHPSQAGNQHIQPSMEVLDDYFVRVSMIAGHVITAAKDVLHLHNKNGYLKELDGIFKKNPYPGELLTSLTKPDIQVGDFVIASNDLGEVVRVNRSQYGYRSFAVRYLSEPPIPNIHIDEIPARYVKLFYKKKVIADKVRKLIIEKAPGAKPSTRGINIALRKTVIHTWSIGMKEIMQGNPDKGYEKMAEYLKQEKERAGIPPSPPGAI